jgi:VWFA-related protein
MKTSLNKTSLEISARNFYCSDYQGSLTSTIGRNLLVAIVPVLLSWTAAFGQQAPPELSIRTATRVVLVDAIVTDADSHPVKGLVASDFAVLEDGKLQKISFFSFESPPQHQAAPPQLRPDVFTNRPEYHSAGGPLVILLLDGLNTPPTQQAYVRQQILKYLASLRISSPGTAILALGNDLSILQDFTTSPQLLLAAARSYKGERTAVDVESPKIEIPVTTGPGGGIPAQADVQGPPVDSGTEVSAGTYVLNTFQELADSLKRFDKAVSVDNQDARVRATLAALRTISRAVVGYRGRKALIWFSAGFPFSLALDETMDLDFSKSYRDQIRQAAALLSDADVAVYPIDARGLVTVGGLADPTTPATQGPPDKSLAAVTWQKFNTEGTMDHLARDTGGEVFRNTNDLNGALQAAIADSESCYVLGYYPERKNWDGKFHNLKVLVRNKELRIRSRTGYFAVDPANWRKGGYEKMISPSALHMLASTGVLFYVHPISPQKKDNPTSIEILVDANTVSFGSGPEFTYETDLEFQVGAFAPDGKLVRLETQTAQAVLRNETYQQFIKTGIPVRVPILLKSGKYLLRVAARDNRNGHIGTLDVPLNIQ